jgi:arylsulfatase A-like enzyme
MICAIIIQATLGCLIAGTPEKLASSPNVLLITVDDLNDWIGPLSGHPQAKTPNLDRLAARGVTFTSAHCQAPLCNPSRTSFLTSLRPTTTGIYTLEGWFRDSPNFNDHLTLPEAFADHGYEVAIGGKIFHIKGPLRKDLQSAFTWGPPGEMGPYPEKRLVDIKDNLRAIDWGPFPEHDEQTTDYKTATWACQQLVKQRQKPLFLAVGFHRPHVPCFAPHPWFDLYPLDSLTMPLILDNDRDDTPPFSWYLYWRTPEPRVSWLRRTGELKTLVRSYLACVSYVDAMIGHVLDELERSGQQDNTIVVVLGDHGWHLGEKGITGKNSLWERSTHVPLIFAGPGCRAGTVREEPVELLDIYPTLLSLAHLTVTSKLEGDSLADQLSDRDAPHHRPAITSQGPGNHTVRTKDWRYIRYADGSEELYDLKNDRHEWHNVASRPDLASRKTELAGWIPQKIAAPVPRSHSRLIEMKDGIPYWEEKPIHPEDGPPE